MAILPISSYFVSLNLIWGGNTTGAGLTAAGVANLILGGYVWVAMKEDGKMSIDISKEKKSE